MKSTTFIAAGTALLSSTHASSVTLQTTKCVSGNGLIEKFDVPVNEGPTTLYLAQICGLEILSSSTDIDVNTVSCQAFKDLKGTVPGSAVFTIDNPALISTNPVAEGSVWCQSTAPVARRQNDNATVSAVLPTASSASDSAIESSLQTETQSVSVSASTVLTTSTVSAASSAASSAAPSTIVQTIVASASSGLPTASGNETAPSNTAHPSASQSAGVPPENGAAVGMGMSVGVLAAAFAALLL